MATTGKPINFDERVNLLSSIDTIPFQEDTAYIMGKKYQSKTQAILLASSDELMRQKNVTGCGFISNMYNNLIGHQRSPAEKLLYDFSDSIFILKVSFYNTAGQQACHPRFSSCILIAPDTILSSAHTFEKPTKTIISATATVHSSVSGSALATATSYIFPRHEANTPLPFGTIPQPDDDFALLNIHLPNHEEFLQPSSPQLPRSTMRILGFNFRPNCEELARIYRGEVEPRQLEVAVEELAPMKLSVGSSEGVVGSRVPVGAKMSGRSRFLRDREGCDLAYTISTTAGSSGSAVFDQDNRWIGVHHGVLTSFEEDGQQVIDTDTFNHGLCLRHPKLQRFILDYLAKRNNCQSIAKIWSLLE